MHTLALTVAFVFSFVVLVPPVHAQSSQHAIPSSALGALIQEHSDAVAADREAVAKLLERAEVQKIAKDAGLDLRTAQNAVAVLSPQELAQIASQARQAEQALAGGQSRVTISTTMIIIGLLLLILLIVALN